MSIFANYLFLFTLIGGFAMQACAQDQSSSEQYGRLFNNTNQRQQLESQRSAPSRNLPIKKSVALEEPIEAPMTKPVTLNGYVKRSDGKSTVWINRQPVQENTTLDTVQIGKLSSTGELQYGRKQKIQTDKLIINLPTNGQRVQLKAGQQYDPQSHQIKEVTTLAKERQILLNSADEATHLE